MDGDTENTDASERGPELPDEFIKRLKEEHMKEINNLKRSLAAVEEGAEKKFKGVEEILQATSCSEHDTKDPQQALYFEAVMNKLQRIEDMLQAIEDQNKKALGLIRTMSPRADWMQAIIDLVDDQGIVLRRRVPPNMSSVRKSSGGKKPRPTITAKIPSPETADSFPPPQYRKVKEIELAMENAFEESNAILSAAERSHLKLRKMADVLKRVYNKSTEDAISRKAPQSLGNYLSTIESECEGRLFYTGHEGVEYTE